MEAENLPGDKFIQLTKQVLIDYQQKLGQGAFGKVYKGYHKTLGKLIAVKLIYLKDQIIRKYANRELETMEDLKEYTHPNIMGYYGHTFAKQGLYCFMELCQGGSLEKVLKRDGKISQLRVLQLFGQLLDAMCYFSSKKKIHRDLKLQNLMQNQKGQLKVGDFGLARQIKDSRMTRGVGTRIYRAPEVQFTEKYDERCDVWSAGLVLYEMLVGEIYFQAVTHQQFLRRLKKFGQQGEQITFPKGFHPIWEKLTRMMVVYNQENRKTFSQVQSQFNRFKEKMRADIASKQASTNRMNNVKKFLIFFRLKTDQFDRILSMSGNSDYRYIRNVQKYLIVFLALSMLYARVNALLRELQLQQISTPDGTIKADSFIQQHKGQFKRRVTSYKIKLQSALERYSKCIIEKVSGPILDKYMKRAKDQKRVNKACKVCDYPIIDLVRKSLKGQFVPEKQYWQIYRKLIDSEKIKICNKALPELSHQHLKIYTYIRIVCYLDGIFPDSCYKKEDYMQLRLQEIENKDRTALIQFVSPWNN